MNRVVTRFLTSIVPAAAVGIGLALAAPTTAQANPPIVHSFASLHEALDSATFFTQDLNRTLNLLISYNDTIALYKAQPAADQAEVAADGHDHDHAGEEVLSVFTIKSENFAAPGSFQSFSLLSSALYEGIALPLRFSLFNETADRIERGMMIKALPMSVPVEGTVTSGFGMRNHPILSGRRMHKGLDIAAPSGTSIYATGGGTVIFAGRKNGYGNVVIVDHGYGYTTLYAHCSKLLVEEGANVSRGDLIALVGSTGRSTGPHLHYEVRLNDVHMNPELFLIYSREKTESLAAVADHYLTF